MSLSSETQIRRGTRLELSRRAFIWATSHHYSPFTYRVTTVVPWFYTLLTVPGKVIHLSVTSSVVCLHILTT